MLFFTLLCSAQVKITVNDVYKNYLKAIDPNNQFSKLNSLTKEERVKSVIKVAGNTTQSNYVMLNYTNSASQVVSLMKMEAMSTKTVFDGSSGYTELSTGFKTQMDDNIKKLFKQNKGGFVLEQHAPQDAILEESIFDGKEVYKVSYTVGEEGQKSQIHDLYDAQDFKKISTTISTLVKGIKSDSNITYQNYSDFNGILQPTYTTTVVVTSGSNVNSEIQTNSEINYRFNESFETYANPSIKSIASNMASIPEGIVTTEGTLTLPNTKVNIEDSDAIAVRLKDVEDLTESELFNSLNKREQNYQLMLKNMRDAGEPSNNSYSVNIAESSVSNSEPERISRMEAANSGALKYRRSSLYTMMLDDNTREHYNVIKDAFGNTALSEKFNNHNIGPYLIPAHGGSGEDDQTQLIENYLNNNGVARNLVAKWFNRDDKGQFNMNLIAERGQYNASEIDLKIAQSSMRGKALLSDAGRELIGNTFIIVYDYRYTNKEDQAKKRKGFFNAISSVASYVPGGDKVMNVATVAGVASDVVGKGYFVKTTSYLYRLVWNDAVANEFYQTLWMDESTYDASKKEAFDTSNLFKLEYVGDEVSRNNLQSTIFSSKSNEQLIEIATTKAVDKNIGKLQRAYEEFRVKTPLLFIDPIAAKIGLKEDIEKNDKFEVLEQVLNEDGTTAYQRVGVIQVDGNQIWDNTFMADQANENTESNQNDSSSIGVALNGEKKQKKFSSLIGRLVKEKSESADQKVSQTQDLGYTVFKGNAKKLAPGMLIRQIN